jgi:hypothetical protein
MNIRKKTFVAASVLGVTYLCMGSAFAQLDIEIENPNPCTIARSNRVTVRVAAAPEGWTQINLQFSNDNGFVLETTSIRRSDDGTQKTIDI